MSCSLAGIENSQTGTLATALAGTLVSSLHRLKDSDNTDGAFFVFGDLSVRVEGKFRLQFDLYEMRDTECFHVKSVQSDPFTVHSTKGFPGMTESTFLTRSFSDQGVRLRLRKEPRSLLRKRGPAADDYEPRHYKSKQNQNERSDRVSEESEHSFDTPRQGQSEQPGSMYAYPHDQRPQMGREYSQQSISSYGGDDPSFKRPRTGSEQSQTGSFSQQQPVDSPQYQSRMYPDPPQAYNQFGQQTPQAQVYGQSYSQSPQSTNISSRDQYFAQRLSSQSDISSPFDPNTQRSPHSAYFPPQPQAVRYPQQPQYGGSGGLIAPSPPQRVTGAFEGLAMRPQIPSGMMGSSMTGMQPSVYGRMPSTSTYGFVAGGRREGYEAYPIHSQNLSAGSIDAIATTTAPAPWSSSPY